MCQPSVTLNLDKIVARGHSNNAFLMSALPPSRQFGAPGDDSVQYLYPLDIQNLLLSICLPGLYTMRPRWCSLYRTDLIKHVCLVVCDSMTSADIATFELTSSKSSTNQRVFLSQLQEHIEFISSLSFESDFFTELLAVPLRFLEPKFRQSFDSANASNRLKLVAKRHEPISLENTAAGVTTSVVTPTTAQRAWCTSASTKDAYPRSLLVLSCVEMSRENIPLPHSIPKKDNFVFSKSSYTEITDKSPFFGLDCEMVNTEAGIREIARVTLVDENYKSIYDEYVQPEARVVDYLTRFSGITKRILDPVTKRLKDVHRDFDRLLPCDAIIVGHSASCDMHALKMMHPYVIDTSVVFNMTGVRVQKPALKRLVYHHLGRTIQANKSGHCSYEDAKACLELIKLKLSKSLEFGDICATVAVNRSLHTIGELPSPANTINRFSGPVSTTVHIAKADDLAIERKKPRLLPSGQLNESIDLKETEKSDSVSADGDKDDLKHKTKPAANDGTTTKTSVFSREAFFLSALTKPWAQNLVNLVSTAADQRIALIGQSSSILMSGETTSVASDNVDEVVVSTDEEAACQASKYAQAVRLSLVSMGGRHCAEQLNQQTTASWTEKTASLSALEKNLVSIYQSLPATSLMLVVIPGGPTSNLDMADRGRCYFQVKPSGLE